jgi:hypothetical protein
MSAQGRVPVVPAAEFPGSLAQPVYADPAPRSELAITAREAGWLTLLAAAAVVAVRFCGF